MKNADPIAAEMEGWERITIIHVYTLIISADLLFESNIMIVAGPPKPWDVPGLRTNVFSACVLTHT